MTSVSKITTNKVILWLMTKYQKKIIPSSIRQHIKIKDSFLCKNENKIKQKYSVLRRVKLIIR